jgi:hypothetical protein
VILHHKPAFVISQRTIKVLICFSELKNVGRRSNFATIIPPSPRKYAPTGRNKEKYSGKKKPAHLSVAGLNPIL